MKELFRKLPELQTERLLLRKLRMSDMNDLYAYARHEEVFRHTAFQAHKSPDETLRFIQIQLEAYERDEPAAWGIEFEKNLVGTFGFIAHDPGARCGEIGFALSKDLWGRGIIPEAGKKVRDFGFEILQLNRLEAFCDPRNLGAKRALEKMGLHLEGVLRQKLFLAGEFLDICSYALLQSEWKEKRAFKP